MGIPAVIAHSVGLVLGDALRKPVRHVDGHDGIGDETVGKPGKNIWTILFPLIAEILQVKRRYSLRTFTGRP